VRRRRVEEEEGRSRRMDKRGRNKSPSLLFVMEEDGGGTQTF